MKEHLEYLGTENGVEAYRDKRSGKKLYTARTRPALSDAEAERLTDLNKQAGELVSPYILSRKALGFFDKRRLRKGIDLLSQILGVVPDHWSSLWLLGMTFRAMGEQEKAIDALRRAYAANVANPDVGREYAGQCFILGEREEGVRVSRALHARFPDDIGLHSNLALALLIGGDLEEALSVVRAAHDRDPSDAITSSLLRGIADVMAGKKPRPKKLPGW